MSVKKKREYSRVERAFWETLWSVGTKTLALVIVVLIWRFFQQGAM